MSLDEALDKCLKETFHEGIDSLSDFSLQLWLDERHERVLDELFDFEACFKIQALSKFPVAF